MELFKCKHNNLENLAQGETGRDITTTINISRSRLSNYLVIMHSMKRSRVSPAGIIA